MATDDDPKLRLQVLCANCRSELTTTVTKLHDKAHFDLEVMVGICESCDPIETLPTKPFEVVLNDSERVEVSLR